MKVLIALVVGTFCSMLSAFLGAWALKVLWTWFVATYYGPSPSLGVWFGVASIARFAISPLLINVTTVKSEAETATGVIIEMLSKQIALWIGIMFSLGSIWLFGTLMGWIS